MNAQDLAPVAVLKALAERHPHLEPHIRNLTRALRAGKTAAAAELTKGLEIAMVTVKRDG